MVERLLTPFGTAHAILAGLEGRGPTVMTLGEEASLVSLNGVLRGHSFRHWSLQGVDHNSQMLEVKEATADTVEPLVW